MSVYRHGGNRGSPTRMLLCSRCAAEARVEAERDTFTCESCALEQPVLRVERGEIEELRHVSSHAGSYRELNDFAATIDAPEGALAHTVSCNGLRCRVALELNSGTPSGLEITTATLGFPGITLTRETDAEVYAKERGVTREVQVGDDKFDARVFIDSNAVDADVLTVLAPPAVRAAVLLLLKRFTTVRLHAAGVEASGASGLAAICEPATLRKHIAALRVVAGAPRPLALTTTRPSTISRVISAYALSGVPVGGPLLGIAFSRYAPVHAEQILLLPALAGLALAAIAQVPLARAFRGRSASHRDLALARGGIFMSTPLIVMGLFSLANGLFDKSPERTDELAVVALSYDDEDDVSKVTASKDGGDLGAVDLHFKDREKLAKVGQRVTVHTRRGALGARWLSREVRLEINDKTVLFAE